MPEARPIVREAARIYLAHTAPSFVGLIAQGSAVKGDFIPGCSDIDLQLYLNESAFAAHGQLPLELCLAIHRSLAGIDPAPFRYIQCLALPETGDGKMLGPIPGAYQLIGGRLPVPEATPGELRDSARRALAGLVTVPPFVAGGLLEHGGGRLAAAVRLLCTKVWPTLYHVLVLQEDDPVRVWNLTKEQAIEQLAPNTALRRDIEVFYRAVRAYYPAAASVDRALAVIAAGVGFLEAVKRWQEQSRSA